MTERRIPTLQAYDLAPLRCPSCVSFAWLYEVPVVDVAGELHHPRCPDVRGQNLAQARPK